MKTTRRVLHKLSACVAAAGLVLINKVDLLPYVDFDLDLCAQHARSVNPNVEIVPVSATKGDGMDTWYQWIDARASELPVAVAGM